MARATPAITGFNSGELSPALEGRSEMKQYATGCFKLENFIPMVQGPARRRPGSRFVGEIKDSTVRGALTEFVRSVEESFLLEWGDHSLRFYQNHAQVLSGGLPYEIATPYGAADLYDANGFFQLVFATSADVMYITHRSTTFPVYKLQHFGTTNWSIVPVVFAGGPFADINPLDTPVMHASAQTGNVTVTSSAPIPNGTSTPGFLPGHIGALLYLGTHDIHTVKPWEVGKSYVVDDLVRNNGVTYKCFDAGTSGTVAPTHLFGDAYDGTKHSSAGWTYQDPGYGWGTIISIQSPTVCTVKVGNPVATDPPVQYPIGVTDLDVNWDNAGAGSNTPTPLWAIGDWNAVAGFPSTVCFFRGRLCFARQGIINLSVSQDFENFAALTPGGQQTPDQAIRITVPTQDATKWLVDGRVMVVGNESAEHSLSEINPNTALAAANVKTQKQLTHGSRAVRPVVVGGGAGQGGVSAGGATLMFAQTSGLKLLGLKYAFFTDNYESQDLTAIAEHVTKGGLMELAYQQEPDSVVWAIRRKV